MVDIAKSLEFLDKLAADNSYMGIGYDAFVCANTIRELEKVMKIHVFRVNLIQSMIEKLESHEDFNNPTADLILKSQVDILKLVQKEVSNYAEKVRTGKL